MTASVRCATLTLHPDADELFIMRYEPGGLPGQLSVTGYILPLHIDIFWEQVKASLGIANQQNIVRSLCGVLSQALNAIPPSHVNNGQFAENLVVMVIDGSVTLGADPGQVADAFKECGITLAIVATCTSFYEQWDFYRELACNTGGDYMLLEDAPRVLSSAIRRAVDDADTLHQAFHATPRDDLPTVMNGADELDDAGVQFDDLAFDRNRVPDSVIDDAAEFL